MTIILASICAFLVSCATLTGGGEGQQQDQASLDSAATSPSIDTQTAPAGSTDQAYSSPDMGGDSSQPAMEAQQAEHQTAQADAMNEQRSTSELDAAAPESTSSGTDSFYASSQPVAPEVEQVTTPPSELPQKQVASWDQHTSAPSYQEEEKPMPVKKSKKVAKSSKHDKKKIAKHSKKSKKEIAKHSAKKSKKAIAAHKKSKVDCKKVAKNTKKSNKREIAMCKAEIKKVAKLKKSGKTGKVAQAGCQCNYR
jgi:hypothetical protein